MINIDRTNQTRRIIEYRRIQQSRVTSVILTPVLK